MSNLSTESFNINQKKVRNKGNRLIYGFLLIFIVGYVFFFSSKIWMPAPHDGVMITPLGTSIEKNDRTVTVDSWTYSRDQHLMEIAVEVENLSIDGIDSYEWQVRTISDRLDVKTILEDKDLIVLHIENVPSKWAEMLLAMGLKADDKERVEKWEDVKFYVDADTIIETGQIKKLSDAEYRIAAYEAKISAYMLEINNQNVIVEELTTSITTAENKVKELKAEKKYQTETEIKTTDENIQSIESQIQGFKNDRSEALELISEYKDKIVLQKQKLKKLKK